MEPYLVLDDIWVRYGKKAQPVLRGVNLCVERGEVLALLGPSGCGKTTTLRCIAGFVSPDRGRVIIDGRDVTKLPPNKRNIGIVFQSYALFPHLNVFRNVAYGLVIRKHKSHSIKRKVEEVLELLDLKGLENKYPRELSGGQQQRVALARALAIEPQVMLLDEPMSNIDPILRGRLRGELRKILKELGITAVYVTHDRDDAFEISDRIAVMRRGEIEQVAGISEIFNSPRTKFVAEFMGVENIIELSVEDVELTGENILISIGDNELVLPSVNRCSKIYIGIRPEKLKLTKTKPDAPPVVEGRVIIANFKGSSIRYLVETELGELIVHSPPDVKVHAGERVYLTYKPDDVMTFSE